MNVPRNPRADPDHPMWEAAKFGELGASTQFLVTKELDILIWFTGEADKAWYLPGHYTHKIIRTGIQK